MLAAAAALPRGKINNSAAHCLASLTFAEAPRLIYDSAKVNNRLGRPGRVRRQPAGSRTAAAACKELACALFRRLLSTLALFFVGSFAFTNDRAIASSYINFRCARCCEPIVYKFAAKKSVAVLVAVRCSRQLFRTWVEAHCAPQSFVNLFLPSSRTARSLSQLTNLWPKSLVAGLKITYGFTVRRHCESRGLECYSDSMSFLIGWALCKVFARSSALHLPGGLQLNCIRMRLLVFESSSFNLLLPLAFDALYI